MPRKFFSRSAKGTAGDGSPSRQDRLARQARRQERQASKPAEHQASNDGERSDYQQKNRERKLGQGNKSKSGCFPKLFMLVLPLLAVGSYFLLSS